MKFKVPDGCTSLSLGGENIEIKDGFIEADKEHQFLLDHGFTPVNEEIAKANGDDLEKLKEAAKEEAKALGLTFNANIGLEKLNKMIEAKKAEIAKANEA